MISDTQIAYGSSVRRHAEVFGGPLPEQPTEGLVHDRLEVIGLPPSRRHGCASEIGGRTAVVVRAERRDAVDEAAHRMATRREEGLVAGRAAGRARGGKEIAAPRNAAAEQEEKQDPEETNGR